MTVVTYKLETFEGPLDLLLHLIDKHEIDIQDIPISHITDQYMDYIHSMQELELDITSEFLVMAATLLAIKSKILLPKPPVFADYETYEDYMEEEMNDPRAELVQRLMEYRKFKQIARHLHEKESERSLIFSKEPEDLTPYVQVEPSNPVQGLHTADLIAAFQKALSRSSRQPAVAKIHRDEVSVKDRIRDVAGALQAKGYGGKMLFSKLFHEEMIRQEIVVTFLAILELMKMKKIVCYQERLFEDIVMEWRGEKQIDGLANIEIDY